MESLKKIKKQEQRKRNKQRKKDVIKMKKNNERRLKERNKAAVNNVVDVGASQTNQNQEEEKKKKGFIFWLGKNKIKVGAGLTSLALGLGLYCGVGVLDKSITDDEPQPNKPGIESQNPDYKPETPIVTPGVETEPPVRDVDVVATPEIPEETKPPIIPEQKEEDVKPGTGNPGTGETDTEVPPVVETPPVEEEHTVHNYGEWVDNGENEVRECSECGEKEYRDHSYGNPVVTFFKNILKKGTHIINSTKTCEHCEHQLQTSWVDDCSYGEVTYDDTYDYRTCEHCGDLLKQKHVLDEGRIENGVEIFSCTNDGCGYTKKITLNNDDDNIYNPGDNGNQGGNPGDSGNQGGNTDDNGEDNNRGEIIGDDDGQQGIGNGGIKEDFDDEDEKIEETDDGNVEINNDPEASQPVGDDDDRKAISTDGGSQQGIGTGTKKEFDDEEDYEEESQLNFVPEGEVEVAGVVFEYGHYESAVALEEEIAAAEVKIDGLQEQIDALNNLRETLSGDLEAQEEESVKSTGLGL